MQLYADNAKLDSGIVGIAQGHVFQTRLIHTKCTILTILKFIRNLMAYICEEKKQVAGTGWKSF